MTENTTADRKTEKFVWFVGYLPNVDGDFDYDERARCSLRNVPRGLRRKRVR